MPFETFPRFWKIVRLMLGVMACTLPSQYRNWAIPPVWLLPGLS